MVICEGGDTISENGYVIHFFKTTGSSTLKVIEGGLVEALVVGGGGGGGNGNGTNTYAGGGGAGGLIYNNLYVTALNTITITVGAGGAAATNGGNSVFLTLTAIGGGSGGSGGIQAGTGGSGGGGSSTISGSAGTVNQGNSGGTGFLLGGGGGGGGGGGAGNVGNTNYNSFGGDGLYFPQFSNVGGSPPGWFAAGGQGGSVFNFDKKYRSYGGGGYSSDISGSEPYPGIQNTGGGGGGRVGTSGSGAIGGSGIVIIRYKNYISSNEPINFSTIKFAFGGTTPIRLSNYYANNINNYTANANYIPNSGNSFSISKFRNNDNSIDFKTYSYYGKINSNCNSIAIDAYSNIYFTDDTNYISKIDTNKTLNSTFYNVGISYSRIYILYNILYLAYLFIDPAPAYWGSTVMPNQYIRIKKLTLTNGSVTGDVLFADRLHHSYLPGGDTSFWPSGNPGPIVVNPNGDVYIGVNNGYWWVQQDIIKIAADGTKSLIYQYLGDAYGYNTYIYSLAPSNNSIGFYTIQNNNFNFMNDAGTITNLYTIGNRDCRIVRYLNSRMIIYDRTSLIVRIYNFNSSSIIETLQLYNVDFSAMCRSIINDVYIFNVKSQRILVRYAPNDGSSSKKAALSGYHLAQLNTSLNLQLTNGYYWIKGEKMPNALEMYVNFTADGGGYDFYLMTNATSRNFIYQQTGAENLGLDIFYPRSKEHWVAIFDFLSYIPGATIDILRKYVPIPGKVYRINGIGYYDSVLMRDPRFYSSGAPDWMVPDGGKWFIRDVSYGEPNGNYDLYAYLYTWNDILYSDGTVQFDDGGSGGYTGTTPLCSTNFKGSLFDVSTNDGSSAAKAALSGWHLAQYSKTYKLNLASGTYWIKSPKMPNALQMYVDMTRDGGGYDFYLLTGATSYNYVTQNTGPSALGLDIYYPRSKPHWVAIYDFGVNINKLNMINTPAGAVHRNGGGEDFRYTVMRNSRYYATGTTDWRVPDDGKWYLRNTITNTEPSGDYYANAFLGILSLDYLGNVTFNDQRDTYYTGTSIICSTNVKGFSYYD
jgi:hypothetical protein